jgi:hypothetical protein
MTTEAPSSPWSTAISAEASRTDAGLLSATATPTSRRFAPFGGCFCLPISDQLVDQASIWCNVREETAHPLSCGAATFDLGFGELGRTCHVGHDIGRPGPSQEG